MRSGWKIPAILERVEPKASKALFPCLRLGYLVVPPALVKTFVTARRRADLHLVALLPPEVEDSGQLEVPARAAALVIGELQ